MARKTAEPKPEAESAADTAQDGVAAATTDAAPADTDTATGGPAIDTPVALRLVIDAGDVPWSDFQGFAAGSVVTLRLPADAIRAELQADGHPIGEADLVALKGGLGARIASIASDG